MTQGQGWPPSTLGINDRTALNSLRTSKVPTDRWQRTQSLNQWSRTLGYCIDNSLTTRPANAAVRKLTPSRSGRKFEAKHGPRCRRFCPRPLTRNSRTSATDLDPSRGVRRSDILKALLRKTHRLTILMTDSCSVVPPDLVPPKPVGEGREARPYFMSTSTPFKDFLTKGRGLVNINSSSDKPRPELALGVGFTGKISPNGMHYIEYLNSGKTVKSVPESGQKSVNPMAEYCDENGDPVIDPQHGGAMMTDIMGTVFANAFVKVAQDMSDGQTSTRRFVDDMSRELKRHYATTKRHLRMNGVDATQWTRQTTQTLRVFEDSRLY